MNDARRFLTCVTGNRTNEAILERLPGLGLPDCHLVAGCLLQTVWNQLSDQPPTAHIRDYDVFYFDAGDTSWAAEDTVIRRCAAVFGDLGVDVQVRNQARVHRWYPEKFGVPCPPLRSSRDGIDHFLIQSSCVGISDAGEVYAPFGFQDLFELVVRPNPRRWLPDVYYAKAERWRRSWPALRVLPWPE